MSPVTIWLAIAGGTPALACIWDRDTLASELRGLPDVERVIYGDFERLPTRYHAMRAERVERELATKPDDLSLYDDLAAALDRLGRSDDAVAVMDRKQAAMDRLGDGVTDDDRYRTHANRGTFLAHRWLRGGADRGAMADLDAGIAEIEAAIRINPDAHFGREQVQLDAMRWIRAGTPFDGELGSFVEAKGPHGGPLMKTADDDSQARTIEGLRGLIVLGAAWESVDVYRALQNALAASGRNHGAVLAGLRARELALGGARSLQPGAPTGEALAALFEPEQVHVVEDAAPAIRAYELGRKEADARAADRTAFMEARFELGMHPDTHASFWDAELPASAPAPSGPAGEPPEPADPPASARTAGWCGCATGAGSPWAAFGLLALVARRRVG